MDTIKTITLIIIAGLMASGLYLYSEKDVSIVVEGTTIPVTVNIPEESIVVETSLGAPQQFIARVSTSTPSDQSGFAVATSSVLTVFGTTTHMIYGSSTIQQYDAGVAFRILSPATSTVFSVDTSGNLTFSGTCSGCTGAAFAWTPYTDGVSTSTLLRFDAGFISQASSTIDSTLTVTGDIRVKTIHEVTDEGLVLSTNFNTESINGNTVLDSSTFNNHGTNSGATHNTSGGFNTGGDYTFNGSSDFINIDTVLTNSIISTTKGTWTAWVKPVDATPATAEEFIAFGDTDANEFIHITITTLGKFNAFARSAAGLKFSLQTDSAVFSDSTWTHVTLVQDGVAPVIYIDGVAVAQAFITELDKTYWLDDSTGTDNGRIGSINRDSGGEVLHFNGDIDEVKIYNRALSADEVRALYEQRAEGNNSYVSQRDVYIDSTGNVGLGTTSPYSKLTVWGAGTGTGQLFELVDNASTTRMIVLDNGNVGIGNVSPQELLHVGAGTDASDISATDLLVTRAGPSNLSVRDSTNDVETFLFSSTVGGIIGTITNDPLDIKTNNTSAIFIDASQRVGIGTSSPYARLSVVGNIVMQSFHATSTTASSTIDFGLTVNALDVQSTTATSTFGNGMRIENGTLRIDNVQPNKALYADSNGSLKVWDSGFSFSISSSTMSTTTAVFSFQFPNDITLTEISCNTTLYGTSTIQLGEATRAAPATVTKVMQDLVSGIACGADFVNSTTTFNNATIAADVPVVVEIPDGQVTISPSTVNVSGKFTIDD